jgi:hypothetical protein
MRFKSFLEAHPFFGSAKKMGDGEVIKAVTKEVIPQPGAVNRSNRSIIGPSRPCSPDRLSSRPKKLFDY